MNVRYKEVESVKEFIDVVIIRISVFTIEQKSKPERLLDEKDKFARHFIAIVNGGIVSTARARESAKGEFKIGRMATLPDYRNKGTSKGLMEYIVKKLLKNKPKRIWLQAQVKASKFYEKCCFKAISKPYDLHGVPHVDMEYQI